MFILMSRKTKSAYRHIFRYIKNNLIDLGQSVSVMTDFELAMRNALAEVFPGVKLKTCWFHFVQAAKKRASQTPLLLPYLFQNAEARSIYYKLLSLPLLPPDCIEEEFKKLKVLALANHRMYFADFIKYFEQQWIIKVSYFWLN